MGRDGNRLDRPSSFSGSRWCSSSCPLPSLGMVIAIILLTIISRHRGSRQNYHRELLVITVIMCLFCAAKSS